jgi:serine protease inhibitor
LLDLFELKITQMKKIFFITLPFFIFSCTDHIEDKNLTISTRRTEALGTPINDFGFDLFSMLANCNDNVIISPLSIHCDLAMASNAADSQTLDEMKKVMRIDGLADYNLAYKDLLAEINSDVDKNLAVNNSLFYDGNKFNLNNDFYDSIKNNYNCEKSNLDFSDLASLTKINQWAAQKTNDKITKILDEFGEANAFLINAVYFKDDWFAGFDSTRTKKIDFYNEDQSIARVNMMYTRADIRCLISDEYDVVDLPMKNGKYNYTAIVPKTQSLTDLINTIGKELSFTAWLNTNIISRLGVLDLNLHLPKYKLPVHYNLNKSLMMIGMNELFIKGLPKLSTPIFNVPVGNVTHDVFFDLNESGIEGAAITTISTVAETSPFSIKFDRPFLFVLRDNLTNMPIFIGKVSKM